MKIRKYLAKDIQEAIRLIKSDLGPDAVIISSKKVYGRGFLGLFQRQLEVTAALDGQAAARQAKAEEKRADGPFRNIQRELYEVKNMLNRVVQRQVGETPEETFAGKWREYLAGMDIEGEVADKLLDTLDPNSDVEMAIYNRVARLLDPIYENNSQTRIMSFIGPTGVGKTTTLAKLAANLKVYKKKRIAMITIDTYRIGAVEQLKTYAEILDVPFDVVMTTQEMDKALAKHRDKDLILIDTAGRSPSDTEKISELKTLLAGVGPHDVYLVLSCNTRRQDMQKYIRHFRELKYNKFIFTKLDETDVYGSLLSVMYGHSMPVSYITNGQNVPDDILEMNPQTVANLLFRELVSSDGDGPGLEVKGIDWQTTD